VPGSHSRAERWIRLTISQDAMARIPGVVGPELLSSCPYQGITRAKPAKATDFIVRYD